MGLRRRCHMKRTVILMLVTALVVSACGGGGGGGGATPLFVHTATVANVLGNWTTISHPSLDGNPNAIVLITPNWNPGGVGGTYNDHEVGIYYTGTNWAIFNQDLALMPAGPAFNVYIPPVGANTFV